MVVCTQYMHVYLTQICDNLCTVVLFLNLSCHKHLCWRPSSCRLQLCRAACPARQRTEVCSPPITRSARGWPTSATAATGCPPKSWRPRSASQTAPGASTIRYPDASVSRGCWGTASWTDGLTGKRGRAGWAVGTGSWGLRREESYGEDTD